MNRIIKITILIWLSVLVTTTKTFCQANANKGVQIGQKVPDITLTGFLNDTTRKVKFSELHRHRILLLDFWATWCAACINKFPMLDSLKKEFGDKIEIISVGYEPYSTIEKFMKHQSKFKPHSSSVLTHDKILSYEFFPHRSLPHVVWIDSTGKVITITEGENVTRENIRNLLVNNKIMVKPKIDRMKFDITAPFHLRDSSYIGRSIFTNFTEGVGSGINVTYETNNAHLIDRIFACNLSIRQLYWISCYYNKAPMNNFSRMILEINDSLKYMQPSKVSSRTYKNSKYAKALDKGDWDRDNLYCYELQIPKPQIDTMAFRTMLLDLNRNLNLNGRLEKRKVHCYVLKFDSLGNRLIKSHNAPNITYHNFGLEQFLQAQSIDVLVQILNRGIADGQIINETNIDNQKLFDFDISNFKIGITSDEINRMLTDYGLHLVETERLISTLVISEN